MKAEQSDRLAQAIEDLAQAVEENTGELQAVREAIGELRDFGELKAVRDAIDDLRIEYEHAFRNGTCPYLAEASAAWHSRPAVPSDVVREMTPPEDTKAPPAERAATAAPLHATEEDDRLHQTRDTIACSYCRVVLSQSIEAALQQGWTQIHPDRAVARKYLGICPDCQAEIAEEEEEPEEKAEVQRTLL
jgi:hypothetical protein